MDFDGAKENIQPLAAGRNATILQASLVESQADLMEQRMKLEKAIHNYAGDDPLEPWYNYICWIEQSFPSGGRESSLMEVLAKCLVVFEEMVVYHQDRRLIKLFIKFMDIHSNPTECYQLLFNAGIGTMVADFYISWAYYYNINGNTRKADEIFRKGIACRAKPLDEIEEAYQHFCFYIAQRVLYEEGSNFREDAIRELEERRIALTSLRTFRRRGEVGSIRTGAAVKDYAPGVVKNEKKLHSKENPHKVKVFSDENADIASSSSKVATDANATNSVVRTIIDAIRSQENNKEPGPWNKAHEGQKSGKLFGKILSKNHDFRFDIHEDILPSESTEDYGKPLSTPILSAERNYEKPFRYPPKFATKNRPQTIWNTPVTIENEPNSSRSYPMYNKCLLYPRPNMEFQTEELLAYKWFKKRGASNKFTEKRDKVWSKGDVEANMRQYPNFATKSRPQEKDEMDERFIPIKVPNLIFNFDAIYNKEIGEELQFEELMQHNRKKNQTITSVADIEETICIPMEQINRRKSFFPVRKSVAPREVTDISIMTHPRHTLESQKESADDLPLGASAATRKVRDTLKESYQQSFTTGNDSKTSGAVNYLDSTKNMLMESFLKDFSDVASPPKLPEANLRQQSTILSASKHEVQTSSFQSFPLQIAQESFRVLGPSPPALTIQKDSEKRTNKPSAFQLDDSASTDSKLQPPKSQKARQEIEKISKIGSKFEKENVDNERFVFMAPKDSKLPFSIFTEDTTTKGYDADETCSTQTFNFCLKSQSVSTPKSSQSEPVRRFGTVLMEIKSAASEVEPVVVGEQVVSPISVPPLPSAIVAYSPVQAKQLSTILETSEHGTTQGTHSTGASTKSTLSPAEIESEARDRDGMFRAKLPYGDLETLQEQSQELSSESVKAKQGLTSQQNEQNQPPNDPNKNAVIVTATPDVMRLQGEHCWPVQSATLDVCHSKKAGDFTRIEEREDTETGYVARPALFQDDKTETISKMLLVSRQDCKFPDDRTETIPKFGYIPKIEDERTDTTSKVFFVPPSIPSAASGIGIDDSFSFCTFSNMQSKSFLDPFGNPPAVLNSAKSLRKKANLQMKINANGSNLMAAPNKSLTEPLFDDVNTCESMFDLSMEARIASRKSVTKITDLETSIETFLTDICGPASPPKISATCSRKQSNPVNSSKHDLQSNRSRSNTMQNKASSFGLPKGILPPTAPTTADFFELNAETEMFSTDISMIKNSTLLPKQQRQPIEEEIVINNLQSIEELFITEINSRSLQCSSPSTSARKSSAPSQELVLQKPEARNKEPTMETHPSCLKFSSDSDGGSQRQYAHHNDGLLCLNVNECARPELEVFADQTSKRETTNMFISNDWQEDKEVPETNVYMHEEVDLDQTHQIIENSCIDPLVNPFSMDLRGAFLDNIEFTNYINELPTCTLLGRIARLQPSVIIHVGDGTFKVEKHIGEGAYGAVFRGKESKTGIRYALKQERPPNYWEYYICLEVQSRLKVDELLSAYMSVDYALIGKNSSVFISSLSPYGSLLSVVNTIKRKTMKNMDEYLVMYLACELLDLIDHLHAIKIIHADIKSDNFLLMSTLKYGSDKRSLQLIDFGISIDMKLFKAGQTFMYANKKDFFKCVEMHEQRPWTYQLDLFGLSSVIHVLLFGKDMDIWKRPNGTWMHKSAVPRYFNKELWETIFRSLLNVRDCNSLPNLQHLRSQLKECIVEKEKHLLQKIEEFNLALSI